MAGYTFVGSVRTRIFLVLILFGALLLSSALLMSVLGQEQQLRMLTDLGLASIEVLALFTAVFLMVNLILEQMESRTIYLVLTRSIGRMEYLLGSYAGTLLAVLSCVAVMTALHLAALFFKGWSFQKEGLIYLASIFMSFEKIFLISAVALFFSLFSSSAVVALIFTFFFWVLGHFAMEMKFLLARTQGGTRALFEAIYFIIPHFQYLNARDLWIAVSDRLPQFVLQGTLYTLLYSALFLGLALLVFRKKEF